MNLKTNLANSKNYGGARSLDSIRWIVIHYTANDGDTANNNCLYFKNNVVGSSAHYFVDDDGVMQSVPDDRIAWHVGCKTGYKHAYCRNTNSLGVELCDEVKNGVIYPSKQTIANAIELVEYLMKKYNIPRANVIRHYDVVASNKLCPAYWCGNAKNDALWKSEFWNKLIVLGGSLTANSTETASTATGGVSKVNVSLSVLKQGCKGDDVKALQILLNGMGYACGTADGIFGAKTTAAVKKYQAAKKLTQDGIVGANTWKKLLGC